MTKHTHTPDVCEIHVHVYVHVTVGEKSMKKDSWTTTKFKSTMMIYCNYKMISILISDYVKTGVTVVFSLTLFVMFTSFSLDFRLFFELSGNTISIITI